MSQSNWGADDRILKKLYTGRVRPVLEYGMTAWGTAAKSNFEKVSKVQNQAATGARSTPIQELETITGLEPLEDRRDTKMLVQAAKFKRLPNHPMKNRLAQPTKGRLKRGSFIHQARILEQKHQDTKEHDPREIPLCRTNPAWNETAFPLIHCSIPGVGKKDSQDGAVKNEVRWTGTGKKRLGSGHTILFSGRSDAQHSEGVALLLNKKTEKALLEGKPYGPRLLRARFHSKWTMTMTATTALEDLDFADDIALLSHRH
ncbi:hypothetical protein C0Q70_01320 [Pomacea canaliculata]|uniref:Uncharacterized protein n=1 Tax=Pomacea canaliculata TaxID=400727 RepID=A0A2T7PZ71_POMCA|nr:hypothetical protein C0Q70_01320 [Pomacea canaliculata]